MHVYQSISQHIPRSILAIPLPSIDVPHKLCLSFLCHRSRTSEPLYSSPRGLPLPRLPQLRVVPFLGLAVSTAVVLSARRGQCGQRPTFIGRVLYVERLTAGSTATAQFFMICQVSRFLRPVGLQIFKDEESFIQLAEKMAY